jgi:heptosyltransferase-2
MMRTAAVRAGTRVQVFCGGTIVEAAALIDRCDVFVANDTGLLRIADALGKKCVAILGPVDDAVYGLYPYDVARHRMLCTRPPCWPCYKRFRLASCDRAHACIRGVTVDDAMRALEELGV